jgi:predicted MFS family arabinose efflux permease
MILSIALSSIAKTPWLYTLIFMGMGAANDGIRLSFQNLILIVAPEKQRPVYVAIQNNISAFGLFFSIPGGLLVTYLGFNFTLTVAIFLMLIGFYLTLRLRIKNQK